MSLAEFDAYLDHHFALDALERAAQELAEPEWAHQRWWDMAVALMALAKHPHLDTYEILALAARVVTAEILDSL